ncbi:MAG: hypothetical protein ACXWID_17825 [Pyrinomonadaceae bacterium]
MAKWIPATIIGGALVLASLLHLVALIISRRLKRRALESQITQLQNARNRLQNELNQAALNYADANRERVGAVNQLDGYKNQLSEAHNVIAKLRQDAETRGREQEQLRKKAAAAEQESNGHYKLFEDREHQLADLLWLKKRMEEQATDISEHVALRETKLWDLSLDKDRRAIVVMTIRNESVFDITIRPERITGRLFYNGKPCNDPARILESDSRRPIRDAQPFANRVLVLEQPLLQSEAERISETQSDPNAKFWLGNVKLPISVGNIPQGVDPKPLRIGEHAEYLYLKDYKNDPLQEIESQSNKPLAMKELREKIDQLPSWKRVKAMQAALDLYGETFFQEDNEKP